MKAHVEHSIGTFAPLGEVTERYAYVKVRVPVGEATEAQMWALARALERAAEEVVAKAGSPQTRMAL